MRLNVAAELFISSVVSVILINFDFDSRKLELLDGFPARLLAAAFAAFGT